ncbi:MAG: hypothetical protein M3410_00725 [Acidobacteriota bacterium]|nr:hypothetical protein [Acidobacteriota bacterium]
MGLIAVGEFGPRLILAHWQRSGFSRFTGYVRVRHPYTFLHPFRCLFSSHANQRAIEFFHFHTIVVFQIKQVLEAGCALLVTHVNSIVERVCVVCFDEFVGVLNEGPRHSHYIRILLLDFCRGLDAAYINNLNWFRDERLPRAPSHRRGNCSFGSDAAIPSFGVGDRHKV